MDIFAADTEGNTIHVIRQYLMGAYKLQLNKPLLPPPPTPPTILF